MDMRNSGGVEMKVRKAIVPAAGYGIRFLPATKAQPKEMLPIVDKPALQYIIEEAVASGIEEVLIIIGRNKTSIQDHFDRSVELELELQNKGHTQLLAMVKNISEMANIHFIRQKDPKGLGHAIYCAKSFVSNEPFAVLLGDDIVYSGVPCLKQLMDVFGIYGSSVLGVQPVDHINVDKYGIIDGEMIGKNVYTVKSLVEKPDIEKAPTNVAVLGRYIITPAIFDILAKTPPGKNGEIQLTDALMELTKTEKMYACIFEGRRYDVGDKEGYLEATVEYALRDPDLKNAFSSYLKRIFPSV
jgi:UTP--glucose-1-phosphate uridylyltransferase